MKNQALKKLENAFRQWRRTKGYTSEPIPNSLVNRARRVAAIHGMSDVAKATGLAWNRIGHAKPNRSHGVSSRIPAFSRVEMNVPRVTLPNPLAEAETPDGLRVRIFSITPETMGLMSRVCHLGGEL